MALEHISSIISRYFKQGNFMDKEKTLAIKDINLLAEELQGVLTEHLPETKEGQAVMLDYLRVMEEIIRVIRES